MTPRDTLAMLRREQYRRQQNLPAIAAHPTAFALLLEAADYRERGKRAPVSVLGLNAAVPYGTVARHLENLCQHGLLVRQPDPADARRCFAELTETGAALVAAHIEDLGSFAA